MMERRTPKEAVLALVGVINGDAPLPAAKEILDPSVRIHMDSANHRGIDIWYKWIHMIHNCGRVSNLRMTRCDPRPDTANPQIIHLSIRWTGTLRSQGIDIVAERDAQLRYLVQNDRINEIWTHKSNYEFVFGRWIRYSICYRLFLTWALLYFAMRSLRGNDLRVEKALSGRH